MRFLLRLFIFWLLMLPVMYFWGLPQFTAYATGKLRSNNLNQCTTEMVARGLVPRQVSEGNAANYCRCINEGLHLVEADLFEMARTRALPEHLKRDLELQVSRCQPVMSGKPASRDTAPVQQKDGTVDIYL